MFPFFVSVHFVASELINQEITSAYACMACIISGSCAPDDTSDVTTSLHLRSDVIDYSSQRESVHSLNGWPAGR